jgi:predicted protein tyrosine phosphatase
MSQWFSTYGLAEVHPGLIVGAYPLDAADVETLARLDVGRVLNLVEDAEYIGGPPTREAVQRALQAHAIAETRLQLIDFGALPADQLERAVTTLVSWMDDQPAPDQPGTRIYVHCRAGWQRSAAVAAGAVAVYRGIDIQEALRDLQARKPTADPLPHQRRDLAAWFERRTAGESA